MNKNSQNLKKSIKSWWSNHSQDYVNPGEEDHLGINNKLNNKELKKILDKNDKNFYLDAYFAQNNNDRFFENLMPKSLKNKRVLEIGCGLGFHTECLIKRKANLTSIDLAPMSVDITKRRLNIKKLNAKVLECDAENLPFLDNYFDVVWSWGVIHHSPDTKKCCKEIERVLKKEGKLFIMLYNRNSMYNWVNVILRYGILQGKLFKMSIQELHNRYTDGKKKSGAPLSKYFTRNEVKNYLFPNFQITTQKCFEKKHVFSFWVPAKFRRGFEKLIPNRFHTFIWARLGFLLFTVAKKR